MSVTLAIDLALIRQAMSVCQGNLLCRPITQPGRRRLISTVLLHCDCNAPLRQQTPCLMIARRLSRHDQHQRPHSASARADASPRGDISAPSRADTRIHFIILPDRTRRNKIGP